MDGLVGTKAQVAAWKAASKAQREAWMEAAEELPAGIVSIGGRDAVVFLGNEAPAPMQQLVIYEDGIEMGIVLVGASEEAIHAAFEEPELEDEIGDDFATDGPLLVVDLTDDWHAADPRTFELPLTEGSFCIDVRESGSDENEGQVLVFWLPEEE